MKMSKDTVKQMFGKMEKEAQLQEKYLEMLRRNQNLTEDVLAEKLIEFGRSSGFAFSKNDLMAARSEILDNANSNRELSDGDLSSLAGGGQQKTVGVCTSIFGFGVACLLTSLYFERTGQCGEVLTTSDPNCKNT